MADLMQILQSLFGVRPPGMPMPPTVGATGTEGGNVLNPPGTIQPLPPWIDLRAPRPSFGQRAAGVPNLNLFNIQPDAGVPNASGMVPNAGLAGGTLTSPGTPPVPTLPAGGGGGPDINSLLALLGGGLKTAGQWAANDLANHPFKFLTDPKKEPAPTGNAGLLSGQISLPKGRSGEGGTRTIEIPGAGTGIAAKPKSFEEALIGSESGGRAGVVNKEGYAGRYQFGAPRLQELGVYTPGKGPWQKWDGEFSIPGHPEVRTMDDFKKSPEAQKAAFDMHKDDIWQQMSATGYEKYIGQKVGGVAVTKEAILGMAHLGGITGAKKFLDSGGKYNPQDSNGTSLSDYGKKFSGTEDSGGMPTLTPYGAPTLPGVTPVQPLAAKDTSKIQGAYDAAAPTFKGAGPQDRFMNVLAGAAQGAANSGKGGGLTAADVLAAMGGGAAGGAASDTKSQQERQDRFQALQQAYKMAGINVATTIAGLETENKNQPIRATNATNERADQRALQQAQVNASTADRNTEQANTMALKKWELGVPKTSVTKDGIVVQQMDPNTGATTVRIQDFGSLDSEIDKTKKLSDVLGKDDPNAKVLHYQLAAKVGGAPAVYREFIKDSFDKGLIADLIGKDKFTELNSRALKAVPTTISDPKGRDSIAKQNMLDNLTSAILGNDKLQAALVTLMAKSGNPFAAQMLQGNK